RNWQPPVNGADIMNIFGLNEGKMVGILKTFIREGILEGEIDNNRESALKNLKQKGLDLGLRFAENNLNN
ncbi:MAG: tRNA nucleotidyltransferase, partial [Ignavibacteria bacterium]|nr:tRNA nucleotidyltransferase [Ignavibacteria bacterium]